jgi:hypothetical protein
VLYEKNVTEFKTLKIAFGLSFFNLCVSRLLVQTTRFVVKHDNLSGSEKNIFWSKNVIFLTFFQKPENRPLLAHQKGHNF